MTNDQGAPWCGVPLSGCGRYALLACGASSVWLRFGLLDAEMFKVVRVGRLAVVQRLGKDAVGLGANPADRVVHGLERFSGEETDAADAVEVLDNFLQVGIQFGNCAVDVYIDRHQSGGNYGR